MQRGPRYWKAGVAGVLGAAVLASGPAAAGTRSFVVDWLLDGFYYDEATCPAGLNPSATEFYRRDLLKAGHSKQAVEEAMKDFPGEGGAKQPWIPLVSVRGNGKDNVYEMPWTAPDPQLKRAEGRFSFGFNLDGNAETGSFVNPQTQEKGVDNGLFRAMGCNRSWRGPRPGIAEVHWDIARNQMPALLMTVVTPDGGKDGPATVTFDRALDIVVRDAQGSAQADITYVIDPNPRSHAELQGSVKDGAVTVSAPAANLLLDAYVAPELRFQKAQARFTIDGKGKLTGTIGGYIPWRVIYASRASYVEEYASSTDMPGVYYSLKKSADAGPDPKTGENTLISSAFNIEAVPAFVEPLPGRTADAASR